MEILQLWLNLPARLKMTEPKYNGLQREDIPVLEKDNGKVQMNLISGEWESIRGAFNSMTGVHLSTIYFQPEGKLELDIPPDQNIFFYVIRGNPRVNGKMVEALHLVEFNNDETGLSIETEEESVIMLGYAQPFNEPVVAQGPFVMNKEEEIMQAYDDYKSGKFGTWNG